MQRRNFIRLAGGGVVAAATLGAGAARRLRGDYPAAAVQAWQGPQPQDVGGDPRRWALAHAITAPNPHNLQPWVADLRERGAITLRTDPRRVLPQTDPFGRQILIGHGAFLELLVMALAERGLQAQLTLWPEGELQDKATAWDSRPVARLELSPGGSRDPLFAQVLRRRTPKTDFDTARPVGADVLQALLAPDAQGPAGVRSQATVDPARLAALRALCWDSAQVELLTPATVMESVRLTRVGPEEILRHRDGISINSALPRIAAALGQFDRSAPPGEGSPAYRQMMKRFEGHSASAMGFLWMWTPGNTRAQQVDAGRAYVRLQLRATRAGLGVHPMSQALQEFEAMRPHRERAHQLMLQAPVPDHPGAGPTLQMFCRLGYTAAPVPATPRRALQDFMRV